MAKRQFKTESKKLLDMMINSIYTHREIFLRELISNASDALDKLYDRSLTDHSITQARGDYAIRITPNKEARTLTISDNGCGMSKEELESNLGTIAKSGSFDFKKDKRDRDDIDIIGQFGVGFYSAFMVSDAIVVTSRVHGSEEAWKWESHGVDGYTVDSCEKETWGTTITLHIKPNTEEESYDEFLDAYRIEQLVKTYSDYIRYPIRMSVTRTALKEGSDEEYETVVEDKTLNSMTPIWKKTPSDVTPEEYNGFYQDMFSDWDDPARVIRQKSEGLTSYEALLFIPKHAPYDYYTKEFEKGLRLYSGGVMIMEKCKDLLPDYFSFVRGVVDSADLTLNISRETLQHNRQLKVIAKGVEKKIAGELKKMLTEDRGAYEEFFRSFGMQLKWGVYSDYGMHREVLEDLILFISSKEKAYVTLSEYVARMPEGQSKIYYAAGESVDKIAMLPQVEACVARGYEVLYLTDDVDEFALKILRTYQDKEFSNICSDPVDTATEEEKESLKQENEKNDEILRFMKESIGDDVFAVRFTASLADHPVCLTTEGDVSLEMEKILGKMPGTDGSVKANVVLEINRNHPLAARVKALYVTDRDKLATYSKILYAQARLISGLTVENPAEIAAMVCSLMIE